MTISNIQKRKFLQNLYQLLYSSGVSDSNSAVRQPKEEEVKREFDSYFSTNRLGLPLSIDVNAIRNTEVTDPDLMNIYLARSLFNLEVLYDSVFENNEDLMKVVTVLNKRFDDLKARRSKLEKRVDDLLFSITNTDGFFYSFSDSFRNLNNVDLNLSTSYVDTENGKVTLPKLKSSIFDFSAPGKVALENIKYSIIFNGNPVVTDATLEDASALFDGLNNTYCTVSHSSSVLGACAVIVNIPITSPFVISKVQGRMSTGSPVTVIAEIVDTTNTNSIQYRRKQSSGDYDRFSFDFTPQTAGLIRLTFIKYDSDTRDLSGSQNQYIYNFNIRDLIVSGEYYDRQAVFVSSPISIPAGDNNKVIDAVTVEASNANPEVGNINFFVAQDVDNAKNISDFNWIPISSNTLADSGFDKVVSFNGSQKTFKNIDSTSNLGGITLYPISSDKNLSIQNPSSSIYNGISVYRTGKIDRQEQPYNSYILDSVNRIKFSYVSYIRNLHLNKSQWSSIINDKSSTVTVFEPGNIEITNSPSIPVALNLEGISGFLQTNLYVENDQQISATVSRSENAVDWAMSVYLNGNSIVTFEPGVTSKDVVWELKNGINTIEIAFDAEDSSAGSIDLMSGKSISSYGIPFLRYYGYVDPFDFRVNRSIEDYVFTIDNYLGNKEILSRQRINENSRFVYTTNSLNPVNAVRFRADFNRFNNPFGTPVLTDYRIKFKNSF